MAIPGALKETMIPPLLILAAQDGGYRGGFYHGNSRMGVVLRASAQRAIFRKLLGARFKGGKNRRALWG